MRIRIFGLVAAVALGLGGYLHLAIWRGGYRYAPVRELFLLNVGISAAVASALAFHPRKLTAAAGAAVSFGSLAAFALSRGPGLPTLHGRFTEMALAPHNVRFLGGPAAITVLAAEGVAVVACTMMLLGRRAVADAAPTKTAALTTPTEPSPPGSLTSPTTPSPTPPNPEWTPVPA